MSFLISSSSCLILACSWNRNDELGDATCRAGGGQFAELGGQLPDLGGQLAELGSTFYELGKVTFASCGGRVPKLYK